MSETEMSVEKARELLSRTAVALGYSDELATQLTDAALWLERVDARGVHSLLVYMILTQNLPFDARKPVKGKNYGLKCLCPILAANLLVAKYAKLGLPRGVIGIEGPVAPVLMGPQLADLADLYDCSVRLHAYDSKLVIGAAGFRFEEGRFGHFPMVDASGTEAVGIEFIPQVLFPEPPPLTSVKMSKVRVQMSNVLELQRRAGTDHSPSA
jgi:hypothetical protein